MLPILTRTRARLNASRLDADLIAGCAVTDHPLVAARSAALLAPRAQARLASYLELAVARAGEHPAMTTVTPVSPAARERARDALEQLIARLRDGDATTARGVALTRRLLVDPGSPLFCDPDGDTLWNAARAALLALGTPPPPVPRPAEALAPAAREREVAWPA